MKTQRDIEIRQASLMDEPALRKFFTRAYGINRAMYMYPDRWRWLYLYNPFIPKRFGLPIWIACRGEEIIGHTGAMIVPCKIGNATRLVAWSVDTIVLADYRNSGLGFQLQKANQASHEVFMSLAMSPANRHIKKKLGAVDGPETELYLYTKRIDTGLLYEAPIRHLKRCLGEKMASVVWMLARSTGLPFLFAKYCQMRLRLLQKQKPQRQRHPTLDFHSVNARFGPEADSLWESIRDRFSFAAERYRDYLNWKYSDQPGSEYECFYACQGKIVVGLIIFRHCKEPEPKFGVISEVIWTDERPEIVVDLVQFALDQLNLRKPIGVYCASSVSALSEVLKQLGFLCVSTFRSCIFDRLQTDNCVNTSWHALLSKGDHDWDQYPSARHLSISQIRKILRASCRVY